MSAPVVVEALRTPIGRAGGALRDASAAELAGPVLRAVHDRIGGPVQEVVLGNCMGPGGDVGRVAALIAGLGVAVPAMTIDRQCGSGLAAVTIAAALVNDRPGLVLAGGVESASTAPWRYWPPGAGGTPTRYERAPFAPTGFSDPDMGDAADRLADAYGIGRLDQDVYAARSHARAVATAAAGGFVDETVPVSGLDHDERPRPGLTHALLSRLGPVFRSAEEGGTVTIGTSCGVNDGAAVVAVLDGETHARSGRRGLRILSSASVGVDPDQPGLGLVPAAQTALDRAGLGLDDVDVVELNEAFAGQVLACCVALGLEPERICPQGGALALGHPWGASGAVLLVRLFSQLVRTPRPGAIGLAAVAVGGGQGVAMVVESC